ncbi:MAG: TA system VapC family ribonuclease toxin [Chthoniobacterales bacterium]
MSDLPDLNVWLALANENHQHHNIARQYWENESGEKILFCRITMLGFLRLLTNSVVMNGYPFTASEAWQIYHDFALLPEVKFLYEPNSFEKRFADFSERANFPVKLWTDAYLAALAVESSCRLVSFDHDFTRFKNLKFLCLRTS